MESAWILVGIFPNDDLKGRQTYQFIQGGPFDLQVILVEMCFV